MPDTDNVSWVTTVISAVAAWVSAVKASRLRPTTLVATTKNGTISKDSSVSGTDNNSIAMMALAKVTALESTLDNVEVTAACTPPTSLVMRLWRSPVRDEA